MLKDLGMGRGILEPKILEEIQVSIKWDGERDAGTKDTRGNQWRI